MSTADSGSSSSPVVIITTPFPSSHKLNRSNFPQWKSLVSAILNGHDLLGFADGSTPKPAAADSSFKVWFRQDQLVLAFIQGSLTDSIAPYVTAYGSSQKFGKGLHAIFASKSRARVLQLKGDLQSEKMGSRSVAEFMHSLKAKSDELAMIDSPVTDDNFTLFVLGGLNSRFRDIAASIHAQPASLSFPELMDLLTAQEKYLDSLDEPKPDLTVSANLAQQRGGRQQRSGQNTTGRGNRGGGGRGGSAGPRPPSGLPSNGQQQFSSGRTICQWCDKPGHSAKTCWKITSPGQSSQPTAHMNWSPTAPPNNSWLMDSGASHHITNDLGNLSMHSEYDGTEEVHLTDGTTMPITHTGSQYGGANSSRQM